MAVSSKGNKVFDAERVSLLINSAIAEKSVIAQIAGTSRIIAGDGLRGIAGGIPSASIVEEGAIKPSAEALTPKQVSSAKAAVISVVSEELLDDDKALMDELQKTLPVALARKVDQHILSETSTRIDTLASAPAVSGATPLQAVTAGIAAVGAAGFAADGIVISPAMDGEIVSAVDTSGRPLYFPNLGADGVNSILGRKLLVSRGLATGGVVGDWSTSTFATLGDVKLKVSDQATVDGVSLFQNNLVAILAEVRFSFIVPTLNAFAKVSVD